MLKDVMKQKGITAGGLAEITGISKRTLENYIIERRKISLENGIKIADALGIHPRELVKKPNE